jgi:Tol biopolymer transport system component
MRRTGSYCQLFGVVFLLLLAACNPLPRESDQTDEPLEITPDYTSVVIPPNIAPMNFQVRNEGRNFVAEISSSRERGIRIADRDGTIEIPLRSWKKMLQEDRGGFLTITVYRKTDENRWERFKEIRNEISPDEIDSYMAFRKIPPANILWNEMGIYQRCIENFRETPIMVNNLTDRNCMNCHSFHAGNPEQMVFHMRGAFGGTLVTNGKEINFVETKSDHTRSSGVYPSWHPDGDLIAFSANLIRQGFHARIGDIDYVYDRYSDILLYDVKNNCVTRPAELASDDLENTPAWSADGRKLYYICTEKKSDTLPYYTVQYHLMSIDFDRETRKFGHVDTLISADKFGKSVSFPRESPKQGLISFIAVDYGYFSIYNKEADVYFFNTGTGQITRPGINSEFTESYPSWSTSGSWLMFVSKRGDGILSQIWFSHVNENGNAGKPFVLPQKDPGFYDVYLYNYNRPEFISGKVDLNPRKVFSYAKKGADPSAFDMEASISLATGATVPAKEETDEFYHHD